MGGKKKSVLRRGNKWPYLFCLPFIAAYLAFSLFPMLYSFQLSFFDWNGIGTKTFVGLQNYFDLFTKDPLFWKSVWNTIVLMAFSTPITIFLGMLVAYLLFDIGRGKRIYQTINFFPYITTPVAIGFIFSYLFDWQTGYVNKILTGLGIIEEPYFWLQSEVASKVIIVIMIVWRYLGYYMTIYLAAMTAIPAEVYEAAAVDGASNFKIFTKITIPMLKNTTMFLIVTSIIGGLQMFEEPKLLFMGGWASMGNGATGGPGNTALTTVWKFYNDAFNLDSRLGYGSAIAYSLFIIIIVFSLIGFRLTKGRSDENE
ncbi:MAG: sugar ABC transporter permease [Bacillota bacterium]|nr:sugar ABC transporter permease [Bacillota bacterium]